jgi:hypothetical protein
MRPEQAHPLLAPDTRLRAINPLLFSWPPLIPTSSPTAPYPSGQFRLRFVATSHPARSFFRLVRPDALFFLTIRMHCHFGNRVPLALDVSWQLLDGSRQRPPPFAPRLLCQSWSVVVDIRAHSSVLCGWALVLRLSFWSIFGQQASDSQGKLASIFPNMIVDCGSGDQASWEGFFSLACRTGGARDRNAIFGSKH